MTDEFDLFRNAPKSENLAHDLRPNVSIPFSIEKNLQSEKAKILVVDDDKLIRDSLRIILSKKFDVVLCKNGDEGIEQANDEISAVILDIQMEGKNGFETFLEIKKNNLYLPIIFHSAYQDIKSPIEIMNEYRPFGYVMKGGKRNELLHTLESAVLFNSQINENARLLEKVKKQKEEYRTLVNNLNIGVYRIAGGAKGNFLQANPAMAQILGFKTIEEFITKTVSEFYINPEDRDIFIQTLLQKGYCKNFELRLRKNDGSQIWASISAASHKDDSGKILWIDGMLDDISERKESATQLEKLMTEIKDLNTNLEKKVKDRTSDLNQTLNSIKEDLSVAQKIQQNMLYTNFDLIDELKIIPFYQPTSEVGGDFYGISKVNDTTYRIFIADATGHGVQAALITMAIKGIYDSIKQTDFAIHTLIELFNNEYIERYASLKSLLTAFLIDIDVQNHKLKYVSAGHSAGVLLQDSKIQLLEKTGRMIGVMHDTYYKSVEMDFKIGDRIFLFTDGFFEEFNSREEEFGEERLHSILSDNHKLSIEETIDLVLSQINLFLEGKSKQDDMTILGIEYK